MARLISGLPDYLTSLNETMFEQKALNSSTGTCEGNRILTNLIFIFFLLSLFTSTHSAVLKLECQKYGNRHIIAEEGCQGMMVQLNVCSGFCKTFSFYDLDSQKVAVLGKCCRMVDSKWINVTLNCMDGQRIIRLPSATECRCFDCASDR